ncbi:MAG: hypothetical protein M3083_19580 [Actinomycetota bacterium]|nr:hypothetical protein [Actinomycetota bacterium]
MDGSAGAGPSRPPALRLAQLLTVGDQTDANGRLLLEDSATKRARQRVESRGVLMRSSTCPYQDTPSRLGGRMNVSAYEALRADTTGILDGFAWLTGQYRGLHPSGAGTVRLLYDASYLGLTVPLILFHRAADPVAPHGSLSTVVASIFKASRGLFSVAVALLNQNRPRAQSISAADVVRFAEDNGHFVRPDPARVCAAPTRLIERTISVILTGEGAAASASELAGMVPFPLLWRFYRVQDDMSRALSTYSFVLTQLSRSHQPSSPDQLFDRMVPGTQGTFGQLTEAMLAHANSAQAELNRILDRNDQAPSLRVQELLALL